MNNDDITKLTNAIKKKREESLHILLKTLKNNLKDEDKKIKVSNRIPQAIFLKEETSKKHGTIYYLRDDDLTLELYKYFDFSEFRYKNLCINKGDLFLFRDYGITFYPKDFYDKSAHCFDFKGVKIEGDFDGWDIASAKFGGCLGKPIVHPEKLKKNGLFCTDLKDCYVSGNCNGVDVRCVSFKGAHIDYDNFSFDQHKVKKSDLEGACLTGVPMNGNLDDVYIYNTTFNGFVGDLVFNVDNYSLRSLHGVRFGGVTINGNLASINLEYNNFTGAKNAVYDASPDIPRRDIKTNRFRDVSFYHFYCLRNHDGFYTNEFDDAVIVYDATNKQLEYDLIQDSINNNDSESHMFKNITFLYLDEELEKLINGIIEPEILIQKTKKITNTDN